MAPGVYATAATRPSVREDVEVFLHEHRFLVTKLLESLNAAALPPSTITSTRLRTVSDTFNRVLDKDRELLAAVKSLVRHQIAQKELLAIEAAIDEKRQRVIRYAAQLRRSQEDISSVLRKHRRVLDQAAQQPQQTRLDPRDVVAYAHRIAGTTAADKNWRPGLPMFGFMPPAPQEHMMRAGVLSRGVVDEIVTLDASDKLKYSATQRAGDDRADSGDATAKINGIPIGLGAMDAGIRQQMPPGWKPGDPVDLPLDALLHYMGRSTLAEHGVTLPETWKTGDPLPPEAMEILRKKFKIPEKRSAMYDDEVVDDVESLRKKRRLDADGDGDDDKSAPDSSSDSDSSDDSDSDKEVVKRVQLSLSSDDDDDDDDDEEEEEEEEEDEDSD
ncbi:hypothetical protein ATCC90586_002699 [Pythium insidiosum]|nr:hypothetical protein ATCC90586_002699 [Pythium insidiosum]